MSKIEVVAKIESQRKFGAMIFAAKVKAHSAEFQTAMPAIYKDFPQVRFQPSLSPQRIRR